MDVNSSLQRPPYTKYLVTITTRYSGISLSPFKSTIWKKSDQVDINKIIGVDEVFKNTRITVDDFRLVESECKAKEVELENIKKLYLSFIALSPSQASDERIWVALSFGPFFSYMNKRWPIRRKEDIINHYCFGYSRQRSLIRHGLARLWWIGHMTYDPERDNSFELTEFLLKDNDYIEAIFGRNFSNNKRIVQALIDALKLLDENGIKTSRSLVRDLCEYLTQLGGIYIIDSLDIEELRDRLVFCAENK